MPLNPMPDSTFHRKEHFQRRIFFSASKALDDTLIFFSIIFGIYSHCLSRDVKHSLDETTAAHRDTCGTQWASGDAQTHTRRRSTPESYRTAATVHLVAEETRRGLMCAG